MSEVRTTDRRIARMAILQPMNLDQLHKGLPSEHHLFLHQISTIWVEKYHEPEVPISVVDSIEEAEANEPITKVDQSLTTVTMLTTKLATATGTCLTTAVTMTSTSPRNSTDNRVEEVGVTMFQGLVITQQLVDLSDLTTTMTSLRRGGMTESLNSCNSQYSLLPGSGLT